MKGVSQPTETGYFRVNDLSHNTDTEDQIIVVTTNKESKTLLPSFTLINIWWQNDANGVVSPSFDVILTVIVAPLALGAGLRDTQQATNWVGGAQRVRVRGLGRGDRWTRDWQREKQRRTDLRRRAEIILYIDPAAIKVTSLILHNNEHSL